MIVYKWMSMMFAYLNWNYIVLTHWKKQSAERHVASQPASLWSYSFKLCTNRRTNNSQNIL